MALNCFIFFNNLCGCHGFYQKEKKKKTFNKYFGNTTRSITWLLNARL